VRDVLARDRTAIRRAVPRAEERVGRSRVRVERPRGSVPRGIENSATGCTRPTASSGGRRSWNKSR